MNQGINGEGKVASYMQPTFITGENSKPGEYMAGGETHYAYIKSEYVLYTITETGLADVYLDASEGSPVTLTTNGTPTTDTIPKSLRVGITIQNIKKNADGTYSDDGNEELKVVYAPYEETGKGNDAEGDSFIQISKIETGLRQRMVMIMMQRVIHRKLLLP